MPSNPVVGQVYQVLATVTNMGTSAVGPFNVKLSGISSLNIASQRINGLAAGASTILTWIWTPNSTGTFTANINADRNYEITESNENNNIITQQITVTDPNPDITVTNLVMPSNPVVGQVYQVLPTVTNMGTSAVGPFNVKLSGMSSLNIASQRINGLTAGQAPFFRPGYGPQIAQEHSQQT